MGLDMYLNRRTYVRNWDHHKPEEKWSISVKRGGKAVPKSVIDISKITFIEEEIGYWRKANQIHNWFIEHCADGDGDRDTMEVSRADLEELLKTVNIVLAGSELVEGKIKNGERATEKGWEPIMEDGRYIKDASVAKMHLPTQSGFFFGSTDYDEYYIEDLKNTKDIIESALNSESDYFEYHASW